MFVHNVKIIHNNLHIAYCATLIIISLWLAFVNQFFQCYRNKMTNHDTDRKGSYIPANQKDVEGCELFEIISTKRGIWNQVSRWMVFPELESLPTILWVELKSSLFVKRYMQHILSPLIPESIPLTISACPNFLKNNNLKTIPDNIVGSCADCGGRVWNANRLLSRATSSTVQHFWPLTDGRANGLVVW